MSKIHTAIIGSGFIGPVHAEAVRRTGLAEVTAVSEQTIEQARAAAQALGVEKAYGDWRELLADPEIDVVHICVPNHLHFGIAKAAIGAGKHVVCEKPLALSLEEGRELAELAEKSGLVCAVNLNCRAYPLVQQMRDMVANGDLGRIFAVNGSYQQDWLFKDTDYSWRLQTEFSGSSRAIADIGTHWFDMAELVTGLKIERVCADFATFHPIRKRPLKEVATYSGKILEASDYEDVPIETEDYATVLLNFDGGAHGCFTANQAAAGRKNRLYLEIYGSKCSVVFDSERQDELWIGRRDGNNELMIKDPSLLYDRARGYNSYPGGHGEGFADATKHTVLRIYRAIAGQNEHDYPNFADGLRELEICEAVVASAKQERWLDV